MALLEVENLKIYYFTRAGAVKAVDDISFSVDKDETLGLIGESGCGKTTAVFSIACLGRRTKPIDNSLDKGALPSGYQYILRRMISIYAKSL